jgi:hypothetical protein
MAWQTIEVPQGSFIGWGSKHGQHVTGRVTDYDETGGRDYDKNSCPLVEVELTDKAASFIKGERTDFPPGATVLVTCGQANLKKAIKRAELQRGNLVKITMTGEQDTGQGSPMKVFTIQVDRSVVSTSNGAAGMPDDDDEPPF